MSAGNHALHRVSRNLFLCDPHRGQQEKRDPGATVQRHEKFATYFVIDTLNATTTCRFDVFNSTLLRTKGYLKRH